MKRPTLEPVWHKATSQVGYKLSMDGANRTLFFKRDELEALQSLIADVLEDRHASRTT